MIRIFVLSLGLAVIAACARPRPPLPSSSAIYPASGFGRIGCFAGPGLQQFYNGPTGSRNAAARSGPWLVLDSLSVDESRGLAPSGAAPVDGLLQGTIIFRDDTTSTTVGTWQRPTTDSVVLVEYQSHPPVSWRFQWKQGDLIGEATLRSDMVVTAPNGRRFSPTHAWPVALMRVSCSVVPRARPQRLAGAPTSN